MSPGLRVRGRQGRAVVGTRGAQRHGRRAAGQARPAARAGGPARGHAPRRTPPGPSSRCTRPTRPRCSCRCAPGRAGSAPARSRRRCTSERSLLRMLGMRRTVFVVPADLAPVIQAACTVDIAAQAAARATRSLLQTAGVGDGAWLAEVEDAAVLALGGPRPGDRCAALRGRAEAAHQGPAAGQAVGGRTEHHHLGAVPAGRRRPDRARPAARVVDQQPVPLVAGRRPGCRAGGPLPADEARVELVRRWLAAYGPGTVADLKWWTGWTRRPGPAGARPRSTRSRSTWTGRPGSCCRTTTDPVPPPEPWVALLPALDPTPMGWTGRVWFLGAHAPRCSTAPATSGRPSGATAGSSAAGRSARDGEVVYRLLEDVGAEASPRSIAARPPGCPPGSGRSG